MFNNMNQLKNDFLNINYNFIGMFNSQIYLI